MHASRNFVALALLGLTLTSCGGGIESSMKRFATLNGEIANELAKVHDVTSAELAAPKIEALVPRMLSAAQDLAHATMGQVGKPDISMPTMMACAQQQQRVSNEMKRLRADDEIWAAIEPTLQKTMLLKAMPPR